jgi:hypothetical protein
MSLFANIWYIVKTVTIVAIVAEVVVIAGGLNCIFVTLVTTETFVTFLFFLIFTQEILYLFPKAFYWWLFEFGALHFRTLEILD